jgi:hypothetical protein
MLTTIEAEIDVSGKVTLLEPLKITKKSRVILTLLDDDKLQTAKNYKENQIAEERFARHFGAIKSGDKNSADNEKIDGDLIRILENTNND